MERAVVQGNRESNMQTRQRGAKRMRMTGGGGVAWRR